MVKPTFRLANRWQRSHARTPAIGNAPTTLAMFIASATLTMLIASYTRAHGGPPEAAGIVAADERGPTLVLTNEGLVLRRAGAWSFMCPRLWGEDDISFSRLPLAHSLDGASSFVVGKDDVFVMRDGMLTKQGRPELSRAAVTVLAGDREALFGLRTHAEGSDIVRIDGREEHALFASAEVWWTLAIDDRGLYLARPTSEGGLEVVSLDREGSMRASFTVPIAVRPAQLRLHAVADRLFAVLFDGEQYLLGELDAEGWQTLVHSPGPIDGPIASADGALWIAVDGVLTREGGAGFEATGEPRRVTCLSSWSEWVYACVDTELYRLREAGLDERLFALDGIAPPDPALVPDDAAFDCEVQWQLFQSDLQRIGLTTRARPEAGVDAGAVARDAGAARDAPSDGTAATLQAAPGGCSAAHTRDAVAWPAWLAVAALVRRSRRHAAGSRVSEHGTTPVRR